MKRPRPYIPMSVRREVIERQYKAERFKENVLDLMDGVGDSMVVECLLIILFGDKKVHLDHRPALINRLYDVSTGKYTPDANDPEHLEYVTTEEHLTRTVGRAKGAEKTVTTKGSDIWLAKKNRPKKRTKSRIPSRPFPSISRPFPKRREKCKQSKV